MPVNKNDHSTCDQQASNDITKDDISRLKVKHNYNQQLSNDLKKNDNLLSKRNNDGKTETHNIKNRCISKNNLYANSENNTEHLEYQKILNGLTKNMTIIYSEDGFDDDTDIDNDISRSISESIYYADLPSDTVLSDIPNNLTPHATNKQIKNPISKKLIR